MADLLATSWAAIRSYFASAGELLSGRFDLWGATAGVGLACLLAGVVLALLWRERQAFWLLPVAAFGALTPLWLGLAYAALGWLALTLTLIIGAIMLPVAIGLVANDATRRLPVWLIGAFVLSLAATGGLGTFLSNVAF